MEAVFYHALYGALDYYWHRYGTDMDTCDIPPALVRMVGEHAQEDPAALAADLDAAFEMLDGAGVPRASALACLRHNLTHPDFPRAALTQTRGLLASLELHGTATGH